MILFCRFIDLFDSILILFSSFVKLFIYKIHIFDLLISIFNKILTSLCHFSIMYRKKYDVPLELCACTERKDYGKKRKKTK